MSNPDNKLDHETQQALNQGKALKELLKSPGWGIVEDKFNAVLNDIQSVMGIDTKTDQDLIAQIGGRQIAVQMITNIMAEIRGDAEQYDNNKVLKQDDYDEGLKIEYHD